ncbi:MAG: MOSC domain-containing protein, partial [Actinomycetota bacterium]|nr:MOSC domain-containing protein [Actinomycetota bacterium]
VGRCVITTLDADTGEPDFPALEVLARSRAKMPGGGLPFGMFARVSRPGTVRLGDRVEPGPPV